MTGYVSNGDGTPRVLEYLRPWIDCYKVDLKSFDDRHYRSLGGRIQPILDTIQRLHAMGIWLFIVTLLIPGFNDSQDELERLTAFVAGVSPDIPWHVTAFHKDYKMQDPANTTPEMLMRAAEIGRRNGLRYVYAGNLPGRVGTLQTRCVRRAARGSSNEMGISSDATGLILDRRMPVLRVGDPWPLGRGVRRADHVTSVSNHARALMTVA